MNLLLGAVATCFVLANTSVSEQAQIEPAFSPESDIVVKAPEVELVQRRRRRRRRRRGGRTTGGRRRSRRVSSSVTIPIDVGVAPTANFIFGPVMDDQLVHSGIRISVAAVLNQKLLREQQHRIPSRYRRRIARSKEIRYNPYAIFIPKSIIISPKIHDTGVYGIAFQPFGAGIAITPPPVRLSFHGGLLLKYMYIHSDKLPEPTHFLRPGVELGVDFEFPVIPDMFLLSLGWASQFYVPQKVGGLPWEILPLNQTIWHIGQAYLMFHFRMPYTTIL